MGESDNESTSKVDSLEAKLNELRSQVEPGQATLPPTPESVHFPLVTPRLGLPKVLIFLVLIGILIGAFLLIRSRSNRLQNTAENGDQGTNIEIDKALEGSSLYTNTKYGYTLNFPENYSIVSVPGTQLPESFYSQSDDISFSGGVREENLASEVILGVKVNPTDGTGNVIACSSDEDCLVGWLGVIGVNGKQDLPLSVKVSGREVKGVEFRTSLGGDTQVKRYFVFKENANIFIIALTVNNYPETILGEVFDNLSKYISSFKLGTT